MGVEIETNHPIFTTNMYNIYREELDEIEETENKYEIFKEKYHSDVFFLSQCFANGIILPLIATSIMFTTYHRSDDNTGNSC